MISMDETVRALRDGDRIMVTHPRPDIASDRITYGLVLSGKTVGSRTFHKLQQAGNLTPVGDGLLSDVSQTLGWCEASN